jgi:hypothetical protein
MTQVYFRCSNPKEVLVDRCGAVVANEVTNWTIPTNGGMQGRPQRPSSTTSHAGEVGFGTTSARLISKGTFEGRNARYSLNDPGNLLILQQMRPPSERTKKSADEFLASI